ISGSLGKVTAARNIGNGLFAYGSSGFGRLDVYKNGSSRVRFYANGSESASYDTSLFTKKSDQVARTFPPSFPDSVTATIYTTRETTKSNLYKKSWGERYRYVYSTPVTAPTVDLDTLYGGLKVRRKGGGNQSKSLRLIDKNGTQYVMRALRKNAVQYLQAVMFKDQYIKGQFEGTGTEDLILDVFAGAHPYAPFTIGILSSAAGVFHTNPKLYYIPQQKVLGDYNGEFGNALYMIEEHTSEGHSDLASFGFKDTMISTEEVIEKIHSDENILVDEESYIRARLFDMLIGDWDRHYDQWRWIEFNEGSKTLYKPLPRDRDQAFSKMSDGLVLGLAVALTDGARLLRKYDEDLKDVKGINIEPYPLDMEFIQRSDKSIWDAQVAAITSGVTDAVIEEAFMQMPAEVRDENVEEIKRLLKSRRKNLQKISDRYYNFLNQFAVLKGTNKDDYFTITELEDNKIQVVANRIKRGVISTEFHNRIYSPELTNEIWIYALDDDDVFEMKGKSRKIKIRLIGGQNNDKYNIENGKNVVIYDYKSKKNDLEQAHTSRLRLTDRYRINVYNYKKLKTNTKQFVPSLGSNPDDGLKVGFMGMYTAYGFERNPFTSHNSLSVAYYFATSGFDAKYNGEFANTFGKWNLRLNAEFNSPNYAVNFFGFGNSTPNLEATDGSLERFDLDYNRVKIRRLSVTPSLVYRGKTGSDFAIGVMFEANEVDRTNNRFLDDFFNTIPAGNDRVSSRVFENQNFLGVFGRYNFSNHDNAAYPTLGMDAQLELGFKQNVTNNRGYGFVKPQVSFDHRITTDGKLVLATRLGGHINLGNDFEFFQGATLGANSGLRGYRNERFTGKSSFYQSTDLRWRFSKTRTAVLPVNLGLYGGFDYGRVWAASSAVVDRNFNDDSLNTSVGLGMFVEMAEVVTANVSAFNSDDGLRMSFRFGFGF
ncbi:MAG: phosphoesterase, partial [Nonlabens sp.]